MKSILIMINKVTEEEEKKERKTQNSISYNMQHKEASFYSQSENIYKWKWTESFMILMGKFPWWGDCPAGRVFALNTENLRNQKPTKWENGAPIAKQSQVVGFCITIQSWSTTNPSTAEFIVPRAESSLLGLNNCKMFPLIANERDFDFQKRSCDN